MNTATKTYTGDEAIIMRCDVAVRHRRRIELMIVRKTIRELKEAGYELTADNGEEKCQGNERQLIDCLFACDEARLLTKKSFVFFVFGNDGYDVINDYGTNLEPTMKIVNDYASQLEDEGR